MADLLRILITVKTYPLPSTKHTEIVCTAGVQQDGTFARLYPVDYRYRPFDEQYRKYQWIEVEAEKRTSDPRPESFRPVSGAAIATIGEPLSTEDGWYERKKIVLAKEPKSMCELERRPQSCCSLGIIRPKCVDDLLAEPTEADWTPKQKQQLAQLRLFGPANKPLEKIPYKFSYVFTCEDSGCRGHQKMVEDWEIGQLYRKMRDRYGNEGKAVEKVRDKFLGQLCGASVDTHFFVGTILQHNTWIVIGTFCPPKKASTLSSQKTLW